jgi:hypothetical protein
MPNLPQKSGLTFSPALPTIIQGLTRDQNRALLFPGI